jgi:hypothetical protein
LLVAPPGSPLPAFVPLLMRLNLTPEAVLATYRVGDSPINAITPLNAYFALIVTFCQKYQKDAGVGDGGGIDAAVRAGAHGGVDDLLLGVAPARAPRRQRRRRANRDRRP